jgi:hypothetical protein
MFDQKFSSKVYSYKTTIVYRGEPTLYIYGHFASATPLSNRSRSSAILDWARSR